MPAGVGVPLSPPSPEALKLASWSAALPGAREWCQRWRLSDEDLASLEQRVAQALAQCATRCAASELLRCGYAVQEQALSVGWLQVRSRVEISSRSVFLDAEALERVPSAELEAWGRGQSSERWLPRKEAESFALAHELGHVLMSELRGSRAELAAQMLAAALCYGAEQKRPESQA